MLTRQIARLHGFTSNKKAAERLHPLHSAGLLKRTPYIMSVHGRPEYLYYLAARPPQPRSSSHIVAVAELYVQLTEWLRTEQEYTAEIYYAHELPTKSGIIPDATLLLRKAQKTALFFFEVDNGSETVIAARGYSLASKLRAYASYFDSGLYLNDFAWAGQPRGFRVAFIVPTGRLRHLQVLITQERHDFVLATTFDALRDGFQRPVWSTHDGSVVDLVGRRGDWPRDLSGEQMGPAIPVAVGRNPLQAREMTAQVQSENPSVDEEKQS